MKLVGSRNEVWKRTATKTTGGLVRNDLMKNKYGKIVSRRLHRQQSARSNLGSHQKQQRLRRSKRIRRK